MQIAIIQTEAADFEKCYLCHSQNLCIQIKIPCVSPVSFRLSSGASVNVSVDSLLHNDNKITDEQVEYDKEEEYYYEHGEDDHLSGDYEMHFPRVAFSTKPKDLPVAPFTDRRREGKRKGNGKKRSYCQRKYKDYCIHGVCQYLRELQEPSCICLLGYSGMRCHIFSLPVTKEAKGYNRTVAVTVVAVVLSFLFLTMAIEYHKQGEYNFDNEEKVKLKADAHP
uniref:Proheparin-binding EGF-like growth factor n=1 Tax=Salmo trutta TaxID=8032 RepID=A0A673XST8_SALTR